MDGWSLGTFGGRILLLCLPPWIARFEAAAQELSANEYSITEKAVLVEEGED